MAGFTEPPKTTDPLEILRYFQDEAYKPKSEQTGIASKPNAEDNTSSIMKFFADWWTTSQEKVGKAREELAPTMEALARESALRNAQEREAAGITQSLVEGGGEAYRKKPPEGTITRPVARPDELVTDTAKDVEESAPVTVETEATGLDDDAMGLPSDAGLMTRPKARPESMTGLSDDDMGLASKSGYAFMAPNSLFRIALKKKEAGSYSTLFASAETTNTPWKGTDITNMKMSDVLDLVKANGEFHKHNKNKHNKNTTAIGKYQFIGSTLRDLKKRGVFDKLGITDDTLFDEATQDSLAAYQAIHRLKDRAKGTLSSARTEMRNEWEGFKKLSNSDLNNIITEIGSEIGVEFSDRTDPIRTSRPKARP